MSFQTLIGKKNIPVNEKVYDLHKYVGGPAKKAIELFSDWHRYHSAWEVLEERYGNSFMIAKAFRDKLTSRQETGTKHSVEFLDFFFLLFEVVQQQ